MSDFSHFPLPKASISQFLLVFWKCKDSTFDDVNYNKSLDTYSASLLQTMNTIQRLLLYCETPG
jgi:hypothetical protein